MHLARLAVLLGLAYVVAACQIPGLAGAPKFERFDADAKITGRFTFGGPERNLGQAVTARLREAGKTEDLLAAVADPSAPEATRIGGRFAFKSTDTVTLADGTAYQVRFFEGGEVIDNPETNLLCEYVSDAVTAPPTDLTAPQVALDLEWQVKGFKPNVSEVFAGTFSWARHPNLPATADYFVRVSYIEPGKDPKDRAKTRCWASKAADAEAAAWAKVCSDETGAAGGSSPPAGYQMFYRVEFVKSGTTQDTAAKKEFHGGTCWIPFKLP